mgnify:CR=1 FL=1
MKVFAAVACLMLVTACQAPPPPEMTEAEIAQIETEVMEWMGSHVRDYAELNPELLLGAWNAEDCSSTRFADRSTNRQELEAQVRRVLGGWASVNIELLPGSVVDVISPSMAVFQGTGRQEYTPQGGQPGLYRVHFTYFLEKNTGDWKIRRNHVSGGVW